MSRPPERLWSPALERALRDSAAWHRGQARRGSPELPYFAHVAAVAQLLDRAGFDEEVVLAGFLHDVIEDCAVAPEMLAERYGPRVAEMVAWCTETKQDDAGRQRPWGVRKAEYLRRLGGAPVEARAVALADKLHNLASIRMDIERGVDIWSLFHAGRAEVMDYYRAAIRELGRDDDRLIRLAAECEAVLDEIASLGEKCSLGG